MDWDASDALLLVFALAVLALVLSTLCAEARAASAFLEFIDRGFR